MPTDAEMFSAIKSYKRSTNAFKLSKPKKPKESTSAPTSYDNAENVSLKSFQNALGYYLEYCVQKELSGAKKVDTQVRHETAINFFNAVAAGNIKVGNTTNTIFDNERLKEFKKGVELSAKAAVKSFFSSKRGKSLDDIVSSTFGAVGTKGADINLDLGSSVYALEIKYGGQKDNVNYATIRDAVLFSPRQTFFHYAAITNGAVYWNHTEDENRWIANLTENAFGDFMQTKDERALASLILSKGKTAPIKDKNILISIDSGTEYTGMTIDLPALNRVLAPSRNLLLSHQMKEGLYQIMAENKPLLAMSINSMAATTSKSGSGKVVSLRDFSYNTYLYQASAQAPRRSAARQ